MPGPAKGSGRGDLHASPLGATFRENREQRRSRMGGRAKADGEERKRLQSGILPCIDGKSCPPSNLNDGASLWRQGIGLDSLAILKGKLVPVSASTRRLAAVSRGLHACMQESGVENTSRRQSFPERTLVVICRPCHAVTTTRLLFLAYLRHSQPLMLHLDTGCELVGSIMSMWSLE